MQRSHLILAVILIAHVLLALPIIVQPTWTVHEADFYNVGRTLLQKGRLPTPADFPGENGVMLQAAQPPLYYALVTAVQILFDNNQTVPPPSQPRTVCFGWEQVNPSYLLTNDAAWYQSGWQNPAVARGILRALNVALFLLAVGLLYAACRLIVPPRNDIALLAAALFAFEPNMLNFTTIIGNDGLLLLISAVYVYAAVRIFTVDRVQPRSLLLLGVASVLAILTRLNGWVLLPVTLLIVFMLLRSHVWGRLPTRTRRGIWIGLAVMLVSILGIVIINWLSIGSLFGRYHELDNVLLASLPGLRSPDSIVQVLLAIGRDTSAGSYLVPLAIIGHPRVVDAFGWFTLLVLITAAIGVSLNRLHVRRQVLVVLAAIIVGTVLLVGARNAAALNTITSASSTEISAPLRYYVPALPVLAILIAVGLAQIRFTTWLGIALAASWLVIGGLNSANLPIYAQPAPSSVLAKSVPASFEHPQNLAELYPQVVGDHFAVDENRSLLNMTLITNALQRLLDNYAAKLEFTTPSGRVSGCQFPLAQGLYPSRLWSPGEAVTTSALIPSCIGDLPAQTEISLRWVANDQVSPPIVLGQLSQPLPRASACPPLLGVIDNKLLIMQYTAPLTAQAGDLYLPSVNWYTLDASDAYLRTYTVTSADGATKYTCEDKPRLDTYPFARWRPGETVYFDECALHLPPNAPPGKYQVSLSVKDTQGNQLSAADASGQPLTQVPLTTIDLLPPG